jgi:ribosomal protein S8
VVEPQRGDRAVLIAEGFLRDATVVGEGAGKLLRLVLKYDDQRRPVISGIERGEPAEPSDLRRQGKIPLVRGGLGINVPSTPAGVLVDRSQAARHRRRAALRGVVRIGDVAIVRSRLPSRTA